MNGKLKDEDLQNFINAILALKTPEECMDFFRDIFTISELKSIGQRMDVALMLDRGEVYTDIGAKTGASTATISRVSRCLGYGTGGYARVIERIKESNEKKDKN